MVGRTTSTCSSGASTAPWSASPSSSPAIAPPPRTSRRMRCWPRDRKWHELADYDDPGVWVRRVVANRSASVWRRRAWELRAMTRLGQRRAESVPAVDARDDEFWERGRGALPTRQAQCVAVAVPRGPSGCGDRRDPRHRAGHRGAYTCTRRGRRSRAGSARPTRTRVSLETRGRHAGSAVERNGRPRCRA